MSNDEGAAGGTPETTPEVWDRIRALLRSLPAADSLSRSANSLEKEAQVVQEFLSQRVPLPQLFLALDQATRLGEQDKVSLAAQALHRCFASPLGLTLLNDAAVLPSLVGGLRHQDEAVRKLATRVLVQNLQPTAVIDGSTPPNTTAIGTGAPPSSVPDIPPGREARRMALIRRLVEDGDGVLQALVDGVGDGSIAVGQYSADALLAMLTPTPTPSHTPTTAAAPAPEESGTTTAVPSSSLQAMALSDASDASVATAVMGRVATAAAAVEGDSVLQLRYAELVARAMGMGGQVLRAAATPINDSGPAAEVLFRLVEGQDTLIQFSALELLEHVAAHPAGVRLLSQRGIVQWLLSLAGDEAPDPLLGGTALRVLGSVYRTLLQTPGAAAALDGEEAMRLLSAVVRYAASARETDKLAALQVICAFATAGAAPLRRVLEDPVLLREWLDLRPQKMEMKAAALHALAKVLKGEAIDPDAPTWQPHPPAAVVSTAAAVADAMDVGAPEETGGGQGAEGAGFTQAEREVSELRRLLFSRLGELNGAGSTMAFVLAQLRAPLPATRHAIYDVLCASAHQPGGWGVRAMFTTAGFREFLASRQTEPEKEGKEWKYALVSAVVAAQEREPVLQEEVMESLRAFLRQGPFYVSRQAEVETMA